MRQFVSFLNAGAGPAASAGRSVVIAAVYADDTVEDRAKVSDYIGDDGYVVEGRDDDPNTVVARDEQ